MFFLYLACFFLVISMLSIFKEKRRLRNGVFLLLFLMCLIIGLFLILLQDDYGIANVIALVVVLLGLLVLGMMIVILFWDTYLMCKREGVGLTSFLPAGFACLIVVFLFLGLRVIMDNPNLFLSIGTLLIFSFLFYFAMMFWSFWLYSFVYSLFPKKVTCDFIIIHGSGLINGGEVSPLLAGRIDKAIQLYEKGGRKAKLIASGGKGGDETLSEGAAIKGYLLDKQIPEDAILLEEKSTTTYENLLYSKKIMEGIKADYTCLFVTSNYHVFRTSMYAKRLKIKGEGVGSKTALYYWPSAFVREYVALVVRFKLGIVIWTILCVIGIVIMMLPG